MILKEVTPVSDMALPLAAFKDHLRLGTGFSGSAFQDDLLGGFLRAAFAAIERRTSKALLQRAFLLRVEKWPGHGGLQLPIAPVSTLTHIEKTTSAGAQSLDVASFLLSQDTHAPILRPLTESLTRLGRGEALELEFTAGFAASWAELPPDLAQAVLLLAAHYYEYRSDTALHGGCMPFGVTSLIERYRPIRLSPLRSEG
ncbi:head-tail connector protein [Roseobacter sp. SK209-2-6]|uniref:head-tail connector protein n=1 Tax=Roseobacter sp. SK209-2-6 TaxID=388739 RepID=UPI0002E1C7B8|nr:head-tail connector protein [Roseobacter sp. SK209-2-6]